MAQVDIRAARGVDEGGQRDHRGAVLVVVQHRLLQARLQQLLDLETLRCGEVLELDGAEGSLDPRDDVRHARRLRFVDQDRHAIEADQVRKQRGLALHDRQSCERTDVAQAQDRRAVGDDGDGAAEGGELQRRLRILLDREAHARHARRVDIAQHLPGVDRQARHGADLAAAMAIEHPVRLADEARRRQLSDPLIQRAVRLLVHLERDLPERAALVAPQRGQVLDGQSRIRDHLQHFGEAPGLVDRLDDENFRDLHGVSLHQGPP